MKTQTTPWSLALIIFALFTAPSALAVQFGVNFGATDGDGDADLSGSPAAAEFDVETRQINFALNACEACRWFNYRLNVGYTVADIDYGFGFADDAKGANITNTFGLKLVNNAAFKLWVGPSIYINGMIVDGDLSDEDTALVWGLGPTIGMDFRLPEGVTISIELAARSLEVDIDNDAIEDYEIEDAALRFSVLF